MEIFREIESFERELVGPQIRKDGGRIEELLSDEFWSSAALVSCIGSAIFWPPLRNHAQLSIC